MSDIQSLMGIGLAFTLALVMGYESVCWLRRMLILCAANRIANLYSTDQAFMRASLVLREKLKRY